VYLAELYLPKGSYERQAMLNRVEEATLALASSGTRVRFARSISLSADETCFLIFDAPTASDVVEIGRRAGLSFDRVSEAESEEAKI
jgi:hypothetical protein